MAQVSLLIITDFHVFYPKTIIEFTAKFHSDEICYKYLSVPSVTVKHHYCLEYTK